MRQITYRITHELGLHARPAGQLVRALSGYICDVQMGTPGAMVDAKRILGVMRLALKQGDEMTLAFEGEDENDAAEATEAFLRENL